MNNANLLKEQLSILKLENFIIEIDKLENDSSYEKIISILLPIATEEIELRKTKAQSTMLKTAGMPVIKRIEDFDFSFNHSIPEQKILELTNLDFIDQKQNIVFVGSSGVGKTHLATAIGVAATKNRVSTYFIKCNKLIENLKLAHEENRLESRLKHYTKYKVLIIDEMGFLPIGELESKLIFQLIDRRYENRPTIITTNVAFDSWPKLFFDPVIASAILDRLLHHSVVFKITGDSYRLKDVQIQNQE